MQGTRVRRLLILDDVGLVPGGDDDAAGGVGDVAASGWSAEHTPKSSGKNDSRHSISEICFY